ncbi:MAG TPA: mechanosensitive ion channel family protein, partial [Rubrobacter sp.]|nr:mechanosensitive ion channel family protein [Rubrobacter sp.]
MLLLLQEKTSELAGAADDVKKVTEDATREPLSIYRGIREFLDSTLGYVTSAGFIGDILASLAVVFLGLLIFRFMTRGIPRVLQWRRQREGLLNEEAVARIKRQDTAITLTRNALRYVVFIIVTLVVVSIFIEDPLPGVAGATILAAVIGFGAQSFLRDVIAGFSIVFEGQYSVGDFVLIKPQDVSGVVEELGLRMTKIRSLSGEVSYIPNGTMQGVVNYVSGQQRFNVEVQVLDAEAASRVENALGETSELYMSPPRLVERDEKDGRVRMRIVAGVLPSMAWLVEENLTAQIKAAAGE